MKYLIFIVGLILIGSLNFNQVEAHPGGTDRAGCHHCWTNCERWGLVYGEYHCH